MIRKLSLYLIIWIRTILLLNSNNRLITNFNNEVTVYYVESKEVLE